MAVLKLRLVFDGAMFGPGKAQLLQGIQDSGSIAAAGRAMGMSYRRAWALVEEMNAAFDAPLVVSSRGGAGGGGAQITPTGQEMLALYLGAVHAAMQAAAAPVAAMEARLRPGGPAVDMLKQT